MKTIAYIGRENILEYLSLDITCSSSFDLRILLRSRNRYCPRTNIRTFFRAQWRLLFMFSFFISYTYFIFFFTFVQLRFLVCLKKTSPIPPKQ